MFIHLFVMKVLYTCASLAFNIHHVIGFYINNENARRQLISPEQAAALTHFCANLQRFLNDFFPLPVGSRFHQDVFHTWTQTQNLSSVIMQKKRQT